MQSIKYNPESWHKIPAEGIALTGSCHVKLEAPGPIFIGGNLAGYGTEFRAVFEGEEIVKAAKGWYFLPVPVEVPQIGVPLTNMDKRPGMSEVERMIKAQFLEKALRERAAAERRKQADKETHRKRFEAGLQDENPMEEEPIEEPVQEQPQAASDPEQQTAV